MRKSYQVSMALATRTGLTTLVLLALAITNCWLVYNSFLRNEEPGLDPSDLVVSSTISSQEVGTSPSQGTTNDSDNNKKSFPLETGLVVQECDVSQGRWIQDSRAPLYTNETCQYIQPSQNCMMNGRPDRGYLDWRWKPDSCELHPLDPAGFLEFMRNKKLVFIGDSISRNHMQSLLCALAQVEEPEKLFNDTKEKQMKWGFKSYNFTLNQLWSPFLAQHEFVDEIYHIHLDEPEQVWDSKLHEYDVAIISSGYWWFRPSIYYSNNSILGCNPRSGLNNTIVKDRWAYRLAHRNMLRHLLKNFRGLTILRTLTVDHFEFGSWNTGGVCNRTGPFPESNPPELPWMSNEMNLIQVEEFAKALESASGGVERSKLSLLNVTHSAFMRPDGHPNTYRVQPADERPQNDCLHWCLPGAIDTWNEFIWHILRKRLRASREDEANHILSKEERWPRLRQFSKQGPT